MIRLPPTQALRAFEMAARAGSFARAAQALHLTPSAISHQIDGLEQWLGVTLFQPVGRQRKLTPAGRRLAASITAGLDAIGAGIAALQAGEVRELRLSVLTSLAARWLVPRLAQFRTLHPRIGVHIEASQSLTRFREDGTHIALRYGAGRWAGFRALQLGGDALFPVCAPTLWLRAQLPRAARDGRPWPDAPLIEDIHHPWERWWPHAGALPPALHAMTPAVALDDSALVLDAAEAGLGIALARRRLVSHSLRRGTLIRLQGPEVETEFGYFAVGPTASFALPEVAAFVDWLRAQFHEDAPPGAA